MTELRTAGSDQLAELVVVGDSVQEVSDVGKAVDGQLELLVVARGLEERELDRLRRQEVALRVAELAVGEGAVVDRVVEVLVIKAVVDVPLLDVHAKDIWKASESTGTEREEKRFSDANSSTLCVCVCAWVGVRLRGYG